MSVEVTPEYIAAVEVTDEMLTVAIRAGLAAKGHYSWQSHEVMIIARAVATALLTHLQANPRVPSDEEVEQIRQAVQLRFPECIDVTAYWREWAVEFQRHQFAPKKADVPDAVKEVFMREGQIDWSSHEVKRGILLYELGIQMGKAK